MATVQHPAPTRVHVRHNLDWLWISLSVVLVALIAGAIAWAIFRPAVEVPPLPAEVIGFEYDHEVTAGQAVSPGVTTPYLGYSGELYPAAAVAPSASGFAYENESSPVQFAAPGITTTYFGNSGELVPGSETTATLSQSISPDQVTRLIRSVDRAIGTYNWSMVGGFEVDDETTSMHLAKPGVTTQYFGHSGELYPDE